MAWQPATELIEQLSNPSARFQELLSKGTALITNLYDTAQPLIRYELNDCLVASPTHPTTDTSA